MGEDNWECQVQREDTFVTMYKENTGIVDQFPYSLGEVKQYYKKSG